MKKNRTKGLLYVAGLLTQLGISLLFPILLMIYLLKYIESYHHISKGVAVLFLLVGLCAGMLNVYKLLRRFIK